MVNDHSVQGAKGVKESVNARHVVKTIIVGCEWREGCEGVKGEKGVKDVKVKGAKGVKDVKGVQRTHYIAHQTLHLLDVKSGWVGGSEGAWLILINDLGSEKTWWYSLEWNRVCFGNH